MNSITYGAVRGSNARGEEVTVGLGHYVTGRDSIGRLVTGQVVATHDHYPSVTIEGFAVTEPRRERLSVHLDSVIEIAVP